MFYQVVTITLEWVHTEQALVTAQPLPRWTDAFVVPDWCCCHHPVYFAYNLSDSICKTLTRPKVSAIHNIQHAKATNQQTPSILDMNQNCQNPIWNLINCLRRTDLQSCQEITCNPVETQPETLIESRNSPGNWSKFLPKLAQVPWNSGTEIHLQTETDLKVNKTLSMMYLVFVHNLVSMFLWVCVWMTMFQVVLNLFRISSASVFSF